jgi:hypothetical protein
MSQSLLPPLGTLWVCYSDVELRTSPHVDVAPSDTAENWDMLLVVEHRTPWVGVLWKGVTRWAFHARMTRWAVRVN